MYNKSFYPSCSKRRFYGNRFASISDLDLKEWQEAYGELEHFSNKYLDFIMKHKLVPEKYPWPIDPVHNHTRIWEYPYAYRQLSEYLPLHSSAKKPTVFDVGAALTFLPSFFASLGYEVKASDVDPVMKSDFELIKTHPNAPAAVKDVGYATCDCKDITTESNSYYDAIVCISVLEHIEAREQVIKEFYRILKPGGLLILTVDIKLCAVSGAVGLSVEEFSSLRGELCKYFDCPEPDRQVHPLDILKESNHPRCLTQKARYMKRPRFHPMRKIRKMLRGKKEPLDILTVYGMTLLCKRA